jgi:tRNA threonylcarbamoyladenosine biosynthesis protein TsaE
MIELEIYFDYSEIDKAAKNFLEAKNSGKIFAFSGDLGAGKTTFITALCKALGVHETVTSPTYSIIQEYKTGENQTIFHIDLYRIKSKQEAIDAGVEDCLLSNELCMVEWPERAPEIFPVSAVFSQMIIVSDTKRKLIIQLPA